MEIQKRKLYGAYRRKPLARQTGAIDQQQVRMESANRIYYYVHLVQIATVKIYRQPE